jgi:hypothetical protein
VSASPEATATPAPTPAPTPTAATTPPPPSTAPPAAAAAAPAVSDAGLAEAVRRDLGLTLEEFNAAGQLARTAADAVPSLRELPGFVGISLQDGRVVVEGSGAELQARVNELNGTGTAAAFDLVAPDTEASAAPSTAKASAAAAPAAPAKAPSAAELVASNTDQLFEAYVREVGPAGLQAVAYSGGRFIIRTGGTNAAEAGPSQAPGQPTAPATAPASAAAAGKISPADFVARYANVQLEQGSPVTTEAEVYGGEGYAVDRRTICSTGFGAFCAA